MRQIFGAEYEEKIEKTRMEIYLSKQDSMIKCNCGNVFQVAPAKVDYKQKDDKGNLLSKQAAEHMAEFRVRCPNCSNNFCSSCSKEPYHLGYTCEEAERYANASHCRFCLEELKKPSSSRIPAFRACCDSDECIKVRDQCCEKKLACGHWCKGFKDEKVCLPCLDKKCIENLIKFQFNYKLI